MLLPGIRVKMHVYHMLLQCPIELESIHTGPPGDYSQLKNETLIWFADISHELKRPLSGIDHGIRWVSMAIVRLSPARILQYSLKARTRKE